MLAAEVAFEARVGAGRGAQQRDVEEQGEELCGSERDEQDPGERHHGEEPTGRPVTDV